jgi:hypothetical protein
MTFSAASDSASAISGLASGFMLDGATFAKGATLGFNGIDFYAAGRGGVLGDVDADVVAAGFVFFNPAVVRAAWEASAPVMSRAESAVAFASCCHDWADAHLSDDLDAGRLAELAGRVAAAATPAGAPVFAGWRALPVPDAPKQAALHQCNALRELRMARHGSAVLAAGISPADAVRHRSPQMAGIFGWEGEVDDPEAVKAGWDGAEEATNRRFGLDLDALSDGEQAELVALLNQAVSTKH